MGFQPLLKSWSMLHSSSFCFIVREISGQWDEELHGIIAEMLLGAAKFLGRPVMRRSESVHLQRYDAAGEDGRILASL